MDYTHSQKPTQPTNTDTYVCMYGDGWGVVVGVDVTPNKVKRKLIKIHVFQRKRQHYIYMESIFIYLANNSQKIVL